MSQGRLPLPASRCSGKMKEAARKAEKDVDIFSLRLLFLSSWRFGSLLRLPLGQTENKTDVVMEIVIMFFFQIFCWYEVSYAASTEVMPRYAPVTFSSVLVAQSHS